MPNARARVVTMRGFDGEEVAGPDFLESVNEEVERLRERDESALTNQRIGMALGALLGALAALAANAK